MLAALTLSFAAAAVCVATTAAREAPDARASRVVAAGAQAPDQAGEWQAIPLPGATCGGPPSPETGERAPYHYYLSEPNLAEDEAPAGILIMLSGGGACYRDGDAPPEAQGAARELHCKEFTNFEDRYFGDAAFASNAIAIVLPYVRRQQPDNPFKDYVYVAVPYCTGDVHAGVMTEPHDYDPDPGASFEVLHRGHLNVRAVVDDVYGRHPEDLPAVLTGFSAGGMGSVYNFPLVSERWPRTTLVPDSGLGPPHPLSLLATDVRQIAARWGSLGLLPEYCDSYGCLAFSSRLLAAHAQVYDGLHGNGLPWRPFGFLQSQRDETLTDYFGLSACSFEVGLMQGIAEFGANVRGFVPATDKHVFGIINPLEPPFISQGGVDPIEWFGQLATATRPSEMPLDAIDGWMPCNPAFTPLLGAR